MEYLEGRTLLSWTPVGNAPILNGDTPGKQNVTGRITALAVNPADANTIYVGAAGGGVWRTTNGGTNWTSLTDTQPTLVTGALVVAPFNNGLIVFAGTGEANNAIDSYYGNGILRSADGGSTWTQLQGGPAGLFYRDTVGKFVVQSNATTTSLNNVTVYAAVSGLGINGSSGNTGVWKSTDGGTTWADTTVSSTPNSIPIGVSISDLLVDPNNPNHLFAAAGMPYGPAGNLAYNGVYETTNGGTNWTRRPFVDTTPNHTPIFGASVPGRITLAIVPGFGNPTLYAAVTNSSTQALAGIVRSTDSGATWTLLLNTPNYLDGQGFYDTTLAVDPNNAATLYAAGAGFISAGGVSGSLIYRSTDSGTTWNDISRIANNDNGPHADHHAIGFAADGRLLVGTDGGIWRLNADSTWADLNGDLRVAQYVGIAVHPTNAATVYGGTQDNGTQRLANNSWSLVEGGDGGYVRVDPVTPPTVYHEFAAVRDLFGNLLTGFLRRSTDGGTTWNSITSGITLSDPSNFYIPYIIDPADHNHLLLGTNRLYESFNGGTTWAQSAVPLPLTLTGSTRIDAIGIGLIPGTQTSPSYNIIYILSAGHVYVQSPTFTPDGPVTEWRQRSIPGVTDHLADIRVDPSRAYIAFVVRDRFDIVAPTITTAGQNYGRIFRTTDAGRTWVDIGEALPNLPANVAFLDAVTPAGGTDPRKAAGNLFPLYLGNDTGAYTSVDEGQTWSRFDTGLPNVRVSGLEATADHTVLDAATYGRGVWQSSPPVLGTGVPNADGISANDKFVRAIYGDFLYRTGTSDQGQRGYWAGLITSDPATLLTVATGLIRAGESTTKIVNDWYWKYLGRPGDQGGINYWSARLSQGESVEQLLGSFLSTVPQVGNGFSEYYNRGSVTAQSAAYAAPDSDHAFIQSLYIQFLGRVSPDNLDPSNPGPVTRWVNTLRQNRLSGSEHDAESAVINSIIFGQSSGEFRSFEVRAYYVNLLRRRPDDAEVNYWVGTSYDVLTIQTRLVGTPDFRTANNV